VEDKAPLRRKLGLDERRVVALYCGNLIAVKGIAELVEAMRRLREGQVPLQLVCLGDGAFSTNLESLASDLGDRSIVLPGRVKPDQVAEYLQASDFMVLPSHSEGMPQVVLEAMNCALPIVGTRVGGIPEAVVEGETGLLVDPRSAPAVAAAMERMVTDDAFRAEAGRRSLRRPKNCFDADVSKVLLPDTLRRRVRHHAGTVPRGSLRLASGGGVRAGTRRTLRVRGDIRHVLPLSIALLRVLG
jgi:glycosyltransferase involved in cell wall biosynthesis